MRFFLGWTACIWPPYPTSGTPGCDCAHTLRNYYKDVYRAIYHERREAHGLPPMVAKIDRVLNSSRANYATLGTTFGTWFRVGHSGTRSGWSYVPNDRRENERRGCLSALWRSCGLWPYFLRELRHTQASPSFFPMPSMHKAARRKPTFRDKLLGTPRFPEFISKDYCHVA